MGGEPPSLGSPGLSRPARPSSTFDSKTRSQSSRESAPTIRDSWWGVPRFGRVELAVVAEQLDIGYCSYDFFEQCPHRMACAKCSFYLPKESAAAALLEGKSNLLRMRREIPLTESEIAALDDGVSALDSLLSRLRTFRHRLARRRFRFEELFVQIEGT